VFYSDVVGQDIGLTNPNGTSARTHWVFLNCSDVSLTHVAITGPNTYRDDNGYSRLNSDYEAEHGVMCPGSTGVTLSNLTITNVYGDGIYLGGAIYDACDGVTISDIVVVGCGRHGIGFVKCANVSVDGFTLTEGGSTGFDFEPNGASDSVDAVSVNNFDISPRTVPIAGGATFVVSNITLTNGICRNGLTSRSTIDASTGIHSNWVVRNVQRTFGGLPHYAMAFGNCTNIEVDGCDHSALTDDRNQTGVYFADCDGTLIVANNDFGACQSPWIAQGATDPADITSSGNTWDSGASSD